MAKKLLAALALLTLLAAPVVAHEEAADATAEDNEAVGPAYEPLDHPGDDQDSPGLGVGLVVLALSGLVLRRRR